MRQGILTFCLASTLASTVACEGSSVPVGPGRATATISGEVEMQFSGVASFTSDDGRLSGEPPTFTLSAQRDVSGKRQELILELVGTARPQVGRYVVRPAWLRRAAPPGFSGAYMQTDSVFIGFASDSGELEIVHSDPDRVEGTFRVFASQYCRVGADGAPSGGCDPAEKRAGTPSITLVGSVSAVRATTSGGLDVR